MFTNTVPTARKPADGYPGFFGFVPLLESLVHYPIAGFDHDSFPVFSATEVRGVEGDQPARPRTSDYSPQVKNNFSRVFFDLSGFFFVFSLGFGLLSPQGPTDPPGTPPTGLALGVTFPRMWEASLLKVDFHFPELPPRHPNPMGYFVFFARAIFFEGWFDDVCCPLIFLLFFPFSGLQSCCSHRPVCF